MKDQSWKEKVERKQKHKNHTEWRRHKEAKELRKASVFVLTTTQEAAVVWVKGAVNKGTVETSSEQRTVLRCLTDRRY